MPGVDLAAYNSAENAADLADLRTALGIDGWNLYGVSYGSNLAMSELRDHPEGIRSVVLDSCRSPQQHRRDLVVGPGELLGRDLRGLRGATDLRRRLPQPRNRLHRHRQPTRPEHRLSGQVTDATARR